MKSEEPLFGYLSPVLKYQILNEDCYYHINSEASGKFGDIANDRIDPLLSGELKTRPIKKPIHFPSSKDKIARVPKKWKQSNIMGLVK